MGTKERQERDRSRIREDILTAARELFITEGYRNVAMRKLAERIEYSHAATHSYFPANDDIFLALPEEWSRPPPHPTRPVPPSAGLAASANPERPAPTQRPCHLPHVTACPVKFGTTNETLRRDARYCNKPRIACRRR